jgi:hypothetical protein
MTDPPEIYDPPRPAPPRIAPIATVIFNLLALILLFIGQITAGKVFVGLALAAGVVGLVGRSPGTPSRSGTNQPGTGGPVARG